MRFAARTRRCGCRDTVVTNRCRKLREAALDDVAPTEQSRGALTSIIETNSLVRPGASARRRRALLTRAPPE